MSPRADRPGGGTHPPDRGGRTGPGAGRSGPGGRRPERGPGGQPRGARQLALEALVRIEDGAYANLVLPRALGRSRLADRDRNLATELVYGTTRMARACDWLVGRHLRRPVQDPVVRSALRLGAYQLVFTRIPPHAAVSATVGLVPPRARGLVNAVLRHVADDLPAAWPDLATELSYPDWVVRRLEEDLGAEAAQGALRQMNEAAPVTVREDGYVQDPASRWVAEALGARAGERVGDLCAAPGGKATALAGGEDPPALVVAGELRPRRARLLAANAADLGLRVATVVADGRRPPLAPGSVDRVLVDAPCSGLGSLRRRPDARWRAREDRIDRLASLQRELVAGAVGVLAARGTLGYSVCTLTRAETLDLDRWLAEAHPDLAALPPPGAPWIPWGRGALLLPQAAGTDGMYLLRLARGGGDGAGAPTAGDGGPAAPPTLG